ncbi:MAG: PAS domain S-box protein [Candidatus Hodarchaeota archaeon]
MDNLNEDNFIEKRESHRTYDILDHEILEVDFKKGEECFQRVFNVTPVGLALVDSDYRIVKANDAFCQILGYSSSQFRGINLFDIYHPRNIEKCIKIFRKISMGEIISHETEIHCNNKINQNSWVRAYITILNNKKYIYNPYLVMIEDITKYKLAEERMKRHLMKVNIDEGKIYLITESTPILSASIIKDLLKTGFNVLIITRIPENEYKKILKGNYDFLWLAENINFDKIEVKIQELPSRSVVLLDRIDYIIQKNGFEKTLHFIYKLREIAYTTALIVLITVDVSTLSERNLLLIEKEAKRIESRDLNNLSDLDIEILNFISHQNDEGRKPTYSDTGNSLSISRPTVRKKIAFLKDRVCLVVNKSGMSKVVQMSEIGKTLFSK